MKLETMSLKEILALESKIEAAKIRAKTEALAEAKAKVQAIADQYGIALSDLVPKGRANGHFNGRANGKANGTRKRHVPAYKDPKTGIIWSGMGRPPRWLKGDRRKYEVNARGVLPAGE